MREKARSSLVIGLISFFLLSLFALPVYALAQPEAPVDPLIDFAQTQKPNYGLISDSNVVYLSIAVVCAVGAVITVDEVMYRRKGKR